MTESAALVPPRPSVAEYLAVGAILVAGVASNIAVTHGSIAPAATRELLLPMIAMFVLTAAVWVLMVVFRNGAVLLGAASLAYFRTYMSEKPDEWIERPARTFNNLMQAPMLFYVVALLMTAIPWADRAQISLAWIYVASRAIHALIYIGFNYVPFRFATYSVSCITLGTMWARLALEA